MSKGGVFVLPVVFSEGDSNDSALSLVTQSQLAKINRIMQCPVVAAVSIFPSKGELLLPQKTPEQNRVKSSMFSLLLPSSDVFMSFLLFWREERERIPFLDSR